MKRSIFTLIGIFLSVMVFSQTIVFQENFEGSTIGFTSSSVKNNNNWATSSQLASQGTKSDSATVGLADTTYLTSNTFSCTNMSFVQLEFDQIAKIEFFDMAIIEVSADNGNTWTQLTGSQYLGSGQFGNIGNKFNSTSYVDWLPASSNAVPTNSWWKHETFNISSLVADSSQVKIRFTLIDVNSTGAAGNYGWLIDSVKVTASFSELIPPVIAIIPPYPHDTAYTSGPFDVIANITDNTGLDTCQVIYSTTTGVVDTLGMNMISQDTFKASIPFYGYGRSITYYIKAIDSSPAHNVDSVGPYTFFCKYSPGGTFTVGNLSTTSSTTYSNPFGQLWTGNREQFLILASELQALNAGGGNITSVAFNVSSTNNATSSGSNHDGFTIKMKNTTSSSMSSTFETGLTQVYTTTSYQTVQGWNTFTFTTPFTWDGVSNIIVETCFDNGASNWSNNAGIYSNTTTFNSCTYSYSDASYNECTKATGTAQTHRPDMQFVMQTPSNLTHDIGVYQITNPTGGVVAGQAFSIKVRVKNFGVDTITSGTINWKFDGVAQTPYTISDTILPDSLTPEITLGTKTLSGAGSHYLLTWTDNPNGISDFNVANDSASLNFYACSALLNGTYTIGGTNPDYATFGDAVLALNQCGISGPVTFNVAAGTYNEHFELLPVNGSSATNTVTFKAANGDSSSVILNYNAAGTVDNYVIKLNGASYIHIKNMTIQAADSNYCNAIVLGDVCHDVSITNNVIKTAVPQFTDNTDAVLINTADSVGANITINQNAFYQGSRAVSLFSNVNRSGWQVSNNTFNATYSRGIRIIKSHDAQVSGNILSMDSLTSEYQAITLSDCNGTPTIYDNNIKAPQSQIGYGIILASSVFDSTNHAQVYNNMVLLNGNSSGNTLSCGILVNNAANIDLYYNTVHMKGNQTLAASLCMFDQGSTPNTDFVNIKNNIFTNNAGGYLVYIQSVDSSEYTNDYNMFYNWGNGKFAYRSGLQINDFAAWLTQTGEGTHSDTIDPYYASGTDLHVANNLINGRALPIAGITTDIDGDTRNTTTPDPGADEFIPSPYDATTLAILAPGDACGLDTNETVIVRYKNIGSATISGNFTVSYQIMGGSNVVTENITATILPGDTLDYSFSTKANLDVSTLGHDSTFTIKAWCTLTGDNIHQNDTAQSDVNSGYVPAPPTVTSPVSVPYSTQVTLTATAVDSILWYHTNTSSNYFHMGSSYTTGINYSDDTVWVATMSGMSDLKLTETVQFKNGSGHTNPYPSYFPTSDFDGFEITNLGTAPQDLGGWSVHVRGAQTINYTFPSGTVLNAGQVLTCVYGSGVTSSPSNMMFAIASSTYISSSSQVGYYIKDAQGNVVDAFASNGYTFSASTGVTSADWSGSITGLSGQAGAIRLISDNNTASDWGGASTNTASFGTYNSQLGAISTGGGGFCTSAKVPIVIQITGTPSVDVGAIKLLKPVTAFGLGSNEQVKLRVKNFGTANQSNIPVGFIVNNGTVNWDTITTTINSGDSLDYTFVPTADLSTLGQTYTIKAFTALTSPLDSISLNDSVTSIVTNPNYCTCASTSTGYEDLTGIAIGTWSYSNPATGANYTDYTSVTPTAVIAPGQSYNISVSSGFPPGYSYAYTCHTNVFIDYNRDGDFTDPGELVYSAQTNSNNTVSGTMTVPVTNVVYGTTRMRVVFREGGTQSNTGPCGTFTWGECEDYNIVVAPMLAKDIGVLSVLQVADTTNENQTITPKAVVKNFGTDTVVGYAVQYTVNNGTPVVQNVTDSLFTGTTDTITLASFNSPAGNSHICAKTILAGDTNYFNDESCKNFFGIPAKDASVTKIFGLDEGCGLGMDTVKIWVKNYGVDTINAANQINPTLVKYTNGGSVVSETLSTVIAPGDSASYTFTNLVYLGNNSSVDTTYNIAAWVELSGDNVNNNDTAYKQIESFHTPVDPVVTSPINVPYSGHGTATASSPDSLYWYNSPTSNNYIATGSTYTTPYLLYSDDTVYVEAKGGVAGGMNTIGTGTVSQSYSPCYGFYNYSWSSIIYDATDIQNPGRIDSISFYLSQNVSSYTMLNQKIYMRHVQYSTQPSTAYPGTTGKTKVFDGTIVWNGSGWFTIVLDTPFVYNGTDNLEIYWENHDGSWTSGYPHFSSTNVSGKVIYKYQDFSFPTSNGYSLNKRPNIKFWASPTGCASNRIPVVFHVLGQLAVDMGATKLLAPVSAIGLGSTEQVQIRVRNFGTAAQSNIPVGYTVNNGAVKWDTITSTINAGDSLDYTFGPTADLSIQGQSYAIKAFTALTNPLDSNALNDTVSGGVTNMLPNYCTCASTSTGYEDLTGIAIGTWSYSNPATGANYTDYTSVTPTAVIAPGQSYNISVSSGFPPGYSYAYTCHTNVFIDYNRDGDFTDPGELVYSAQTNSNNTVSGTMTVPVTNVVYGTTRMRVVLRESGTQSNTGPCGTFSWGECEDYNIMIMTPIAQDAGAEIVLQPNMLNTAHVVPLVVQVRNYGTQMFDTVPVSYVLNGAAPVTVYHADTVQPLDSTIVNFGNITLQDGANSICVYTALPGDSNAFNDQICTNPYVETTVNLSYFDNFEGNNIWRKVNGQWEHGVPQMSSINSAHSPVNVWGIDLDATYANNSSDTLYSPKIVIPTYADSALLSFWNNYVTQSGQDGGFIQYYISGGTGFWANLGYTGDPYGVNWLNTNVGGTYMWTGNSNGWIESKYRMVFTNLANPFYNAQGDTVQFRFIFHSNNNSNNYDGWAIDDFKIQLPPIPQDGGVIAITSPDTSSQIGSSVTVTVTVKNFGTQNLTSIPVKYDINGSGNWVSETFTPSSPLMPDSVASYSFTTSFTAPNAAYQICAKTAVTGDVYAQNDETCKSVNVTIAPVDGGVSQVMVAPVVPGNGVDTTKASWTVVPSIYIKNYGSNSLSNFTVEYRIGSGNWHSETYSGAAIPAGDSALYQFTNGFSSPLGPYTLTARTQITNDADPTNDDVSKSLFGIIDVGMADQAHDAFYVKQNEPNPARGVVRIDYYIPNGGVVKFELKNALGQDVINTQNDEIAGLHTFKVDADKLPSGVYYYTIEYDGVRKTMKMVVNR